MHRASAFGSCRTTFRNILANAAALDKPIYGLLFFLEVAVSGTMAGAGLYQQRQGGREVLGYYSILLNPIEQRAPPSAPHAAVLAKLIQKNDLIGQKHQLIVNTDYAVRALVESSAFSITPGREQTVINILKQPYIQRQFGQYGKKSQYHISHRRTT